MDYEYDWSRVDAMLKTWPGLGRRPSPAEVEALVTAYAYPNGRDRASRCDPNELEDALRELMQEDERGAHPLPRVVGARIGLRRARAHEGVRDVLDSEYVSEPPADWVLAHAIARDSPALGLMLAVARRHGRDLSPKHDERTCELCEIQRLEAAYELELLNRYGVQWRKIDAANAELAEYADELDGRFPWRVLP